MCVILTEWLFTESVSILVDSSRDATRFAVEVQKIEAGIHVATRGDLDLTTVQPLDAQLASSVQEILNGPTEEQLILDLRDLVFIDSAGLALLIKVSKELAANGRVLRVTVAKGTQPERILKIGHFDKILVLSYSLTD